MIRVGELVKQDKNPLMKVSGNYEEVVNELSPMKLSSAEKALLACLVISQTEKQYKNYLIKVMLELGKLSPDELVNDWQNDDLKTDQSQLFFLLTHEEKIILEGLDLESHLEDLEKNNPQLFADGFSNIFYPNKKLGMLYLRRLVKHRLAVREKFSDLEKLVVCFVMAQLLISWESSCIHLASMLVENWEINGIAEWFEKVWPIYYEN